MYSKRVSEKTRSPPGVTWAGRERGREFGLVEVAATWLRSRQAAGDGCVQSRLSSLNTPSATRPRKGRRLITAGGSK